jgi:hypothetical protein
MRTADGFHPGFGQAKMFHFALLDQFLHRAGHILHRHVRIDPMLIQEIDAISPKPLESGLRDRADIVRLAVDALLHVTALEAELRGNDDPVAKRLKCLA